MRNEIKILVLIAAIAIVAAILASNYYSTSVQNVRQPANTANSALIRDDSPTLGDASAPVTIVEFVDPECEACGAFHPTVKKLLNEYEGKVRLVIRYMPFHPHSRLAATFTEAAGEQGKYWQAQEMLFARQSEWGEVHGAPPSAPKADVPALFEKYAKELGLDLDQLDAAIKEDRYAAKIDRDRRDGQSLGVKQTPTFFVNGRRMSGLSESGLRSLIEDELKK